MKDGTERLGDPLSLIDAVMPEVIEARRQALNPAIIEVTSNTSLSGFPANKDLKSEQTSINGASAIKFEPGTNQKHFDLNCNTPNKNNEPSVEASSNDNNGTQAANIPASIDINLANSNNDDSSNLKTASSNSNYNTNLNSGGKDNKNLSSKSLNVQNSSEITGENTKKLTKISTCSIINDVIFLNQILHLITPPIPQLITR